MSNLIENRTLSFGKGRAFWVATDGPSALEPLVDVDWADMVL